MPSPRSSIEVSLTLGPSFLFGDPANPEYQTSFRRVGFFGELAVAYRSDYFLDPFLAVGYATLASGEAQLPNGVWGAGGTLEQHLGIWTISPGVTTEIWRFRPRLGIGLALVKQSFSFLGEDSTTTQMPILGQAGLGFVAYDSERFRLDAEARAILANGADITVATIDLVLRADLVYFGGH